MIVLRENAHKELNIDNLSSYKIRHMIDQMFTEYKVMCISSKIELEVYNTLIQCFTGTLKRWWEIEFSQTLVYKMAEEIVKNGAGDVLHKEDGNPQSNMIGALTSIILKHWCGAESEISDKHSLILMNLKS